MKKKRQRRKETEEKKEEKNKEKNTIEQWVNQIIEQLDKGRKKHLVIRYLLGITCSIFCVYAFFSFKCATSFLYNTCPSPLVPHSSIT